MTRLTVAAQISETLARRDGKCPLCPRPIVAHEDYIAKQPPIGWAHATCAAGYRQVLVDHEEDS